MDRYNARIMDPYERIVLKRKRHTIATHVPLTPEVVELLKKHKLMNDYIMDQMQVEGTSFQKMMKFLDLMPAQCDARGFNNLCQALEQVPGFDWLAEELRAELKAEKGELKIEDYIDKEASILVFREFGRSKRLSEQDKKEMATLVSHRTQYAKEVWAGRLRKTEREMDYFRKLTSHIDSSATKVVDDVNKFIQVHKKRLKNMTLEDGTHPFTHKDLADKEEYLKEHPDKTVLDMMQESVHELAALASFSMLEKELLSEERKRSLKVLGVDDENSKIDLKLADILQQMRLDLEERKRIAEEKQAKIKNLEEEIEQLKLQGQAEREESVKTIEKISSHLSHAHEKIQDFSEESARLRRELDTLKKDTEVIRKKAELLDRTRRLGYVNDLAPEVKAELKLLDQAKLMESKKKNSGSVTQLAGKPGTSISNGQVGGKTALKGKQKSAEA